MGCRVSSERICTPLLSVSSFYSLTDGHTPTKIVTPGLSSILLFHRLESVRNELSRKMENYKRVCFPPSQRLLEGQMGLWYKGQAGQVNKTRWEGGPQSLASGNAPCAVPFLGVVGDLPPFIQCQPCAFGETLELIK